MFNLLNLVLPTPCVICSKLGAPLCKQCEESLSLKLRHIDLSGVRGFAVSDYGPEAASIINNLKERGITSLTPFIAKISKQFWPEDLQDAILVPVPSSLSNAKKRGFSHTELIARSLARQIPGLRTRGLLKSTGKRLDQVGLNPRQRAENIHGAFRAEVRGFQANGRPLVLIDDVLTSGATMREAIACLPGSELQVASFFVFARAGELKPSIYKGERDTSTQSKIE